MTCEDLLKLHAQLPVTFLGTLELPTGGNRRHLELILEEGHLTSRVSVLLFQHLCMYMCG